MITYIYILHSKFHLIKKNGDKRNQLNTFLWIDITKSIHLFDRHSQLLSTIYYYLLISIGTSIIYLVIRRKQQQQPNNIIKH